jgi:hypothetical protein
MKVARLKDMLGLITSCPVCRMWVTRKVRVVNELILAHGTGLKDVDYQRRKVRVLGLQIVWRLRLVIDLSTRWCLHVSSRSPHAFVFD